MFLRLTVLTTDCSSPNLPVTSPSPLPYTFKSTIVCLAQELIDIKTIGIGKNWQKVETGECDVIIEKDGT